MARQQSKSLHLASARQRSTSTATNSQPLHHHPLAPACQAAPTANLPAPPHQCQTTARQTPTRQVAAHVSATASHEVATESSLTAEVPAAATVTIHHPAVPPTKMNTARVALAEMESWSDDEKPIFTGGGEVKKRRSIRAVHSLRLFQFAHHPSFPRQAGFLGARPTRSRIRGSVVTMLMSWLRDFVV
jgi:hypothetical protein